jgi:FkbM family methyltransferase
MSFRKWVKYWLYNYCPGLAGRFRYFGTRVHFPGGAMIFRAVCEAGVFEADVVKALVRSARPNSVVFDIGANIGLMAIPVLSACASCRVVSFEPSPNSLPFLRRTVRESIYAERWTVVWKALSDQAGYVDFNTSSPERALFDGFRSNDNAPGQQRVNVEVSTIDDEWRQLGSPYVSAMKIDVEGAEALVLEGGVKLISTHHPNLVLEWDASYLSNFGTAVGRLLEFSERFGYRIYTIPGGVPIDESRTLGVQMMVCSNFMLLHDPFENAVEGPDSQLDAKHWRESLSGDASRHSTDSAPLVQMFVRN